MLPVSLFRAVLRPSPRASWRPPAVARRWRCGRRALRAEGHPGRGPAAHRPRHRVRGAAVPHRRHLQRRQGRSAALRALFATGLFKDVRIEIEDQVAVVIVDERSIIASVTSSA
jgi:hypothetical protein